MLNQAPSGSRDTWNRSAAVLSPRSNTAGQAVLSTVPRATVGGVLKAPVLGEPPEAYERPSHYALGTCLTRRGPARRQA